MIGLVGSLLETGGGSGSGDVVGPASSTANALARYNLTTGKLIKNSVGILDDSGNLSGINNLSATGNLTLSGLGKRILGDFSNALEAALGLLSDPEEIRNFPIQFTF